MFYRLIACLVLSSRAAVGADLFHNPGADLTPQLLAPKTDAARGAAIPTGPGKAGQPPAPALGVAPRADRQVIMHAGQPVADFVFRDEKIFRPCFANVHAPGRVKAPRHHPLRTGADATDHDMINRGAW